MEERRLKTERFFNSKELLSFVNQKKLDKPDILTLYPFQDQLVLYYFE